MCGNRTMSTLGSPHHTVQMLYVTAVIESWKSTFRNISPCAPPLHLLVEDPRLSSTHSLLIKIRKTSCCICCSSSWCIRGLHWITVLYRDCFLFTFTFLSIWSLLVLTGITFFPSVGPVPLTVPSTVSSTMRNSLRRVLLSTNLWIHVYLYLRSSKTQPVCSSDRGTFLWSSVCRADLHSHCKSFDVVKQWNNRLEWIQPAGGKDRLITSSFSSLTSTRRVVTVIIIHNTFSNKQHP